MEAVERIVAKVGGTRLPVLLLGEPGCGKDALAYHIHSQCSLGSGEWCKIGCSDETSLSFAKRLALFLVGNGHRNPLAGYPATLYLDGVEELHEACQASLLRALADQAGNNGNGHGHLGARLVCAANAGLDERLTRGQFSEALYFRISGICLRIPPLRHRREDILPLLDHFLKGMAEEQGREKPELNAEVRDRLLRYTWPGNLRELEHFARQVLVLEDARQAMDEIEAASGPRSGGSHGAPTPSLKEVARAASRQAEKELILKTLTRTRWNRKRAAEELRISYKALLYKLKEISPEETIGGEN